MLNVQKTQIAGVTCMFPDFYVQMPTQQINTRKLVKENPDLGFSEWDVPSNIPSLEELGPTEFWALVFYLPRRGCNTGTIVTLESHLKIINRQTPIFVSKSQAKLKQFTVRSYDARLYGQNVDRQPGIYWKIFDYAAGHQAGNDYDGLSEIRNKYPEDRMAASEAMSVLMQMPRWFEYMNGIDVPYVIVPGYQLCSSGISPRPHWDYSVYISPRMDKYEKVVDNRVDIGKTRDHQPKPGWACCLVR
jgi:hypothetical protein